MKLLLAAALAATTTLVPVAAQAVTLRYALTPIDNRANAFRITFELDSARTPNTVNFTGNSPTNVRFFPVAISYSNPNSTTVFTDTGPFDGVSFFDSTQNQGGFSVARLDRGTDPAPRFFGPQLVNAISSTPGLRTGTFLLSDDPKNVPSDVQVFDYQLRVAAIPEPASWAMMIGGFAIAGAALRRRRVATINA